MQTVLRYLPVRFNSKLSSLEKRTDLDSLEMGELHGILTTFEMRTSSKNPSRKEATFKATKRDKNKSWNWSQQSWRFIRRCGRS